MNFLNEPSTESETLFGESTQESSPVDSSTKNEETATNPAEEQVDEVPKDLNQSLHKDARFKRVIEERNRLRREKEELLTMREKREVKQENNNQPSSQKPAWFAKYFGDDQEAWDGFQQMSRAAKEDAKREALAELQEQSRSTQEASQRWTSWVNEQVESLEEEGETFDKNALFKVMDEYRPTDDEGNLDFKKGLELLKLKAPTKDMGARKQLADKLNGKKTGGEPTKRVGVTPTDLARMRARGEL